MLVSYIQQPDGKEALIHSQSVVVITLAPPTGSNEKRNLNNNTLSEAGLWDIVSRGKSGLTLHVFSVQQHIIQKIDQKP